MRGEANPSWGSRSEGESEQGVSIVACPGPEAG